MNGQAGARTPGLIVNGMQVRSAPDVRVDVEAGGFEGWACRSNVIDSYGTRFAQGCWEAGTPDLTDRVFPFAWFHDVTTPIGVFRAEERDEGLWISGEWDETTVGRDARARAKSGSAPGLSVGMYPRAQRDDVVSSTSESGQQIELDVVTFTATELVETSQITLGFQAVPGAELVAARAARVLGDQSGAEAAVAAMLAAFARNRLGRIRQR